LHALITRLLGEGRMGRFLERRRREFLLLVA